MQSCWPCSAFNDRPCHDALHGRARLIPPADVGLVAVVDIVVGPGLIGQDFGEEAGPWTYAGGTVVILALFWRLAPDLRRLSRGAIDSIAPASDSC